MNEFIASKFIFDPKCYQKTLKENVCAPIFVKEFKVQLPIKNVLLRIAALGNGYVTINGKPLFARLITPQSDYNKTIWYEEFDISDFLIDGENVIMIEVGNGFYNDFISSPWRFNEASWRNNLKIILELIILNEQNEFKIISSDESFVIIDSAVIFNSIRSGEYFDARKDITLNNYKEKLKYSRKVGVCPPSSAILRKSPMPNIIEAEELIPKMSTNSVGNLMLEFDKNISGYLKLSVKSKVNNIVTVTYGEIEKDNRVDQSNINCYVNEGLFQVDKLICGGNISTMSARHTYHGFRYAEIEGLSDIQNELIEVKGVFIHQNVNRISGFVCENELLNNIYTAAINSSYSNFHNTITDCPTREKLGWLGDLQLSTEQFLTNFDIVTVLEKIEQDIVDAMTSDGKLPGIVPTAGWGYDWGNGPTFDAALLVLPFQIYRYCGDTNLFKYFDYFDRYINYLTSKLENDLLDIGLGDWSGTTEKQSEIATPVEFTDSLYFLYFLEMMIKICKITGRIDEKYTFLFNKIKIAFDSKYIVKSKCLINHQTALSFLYALNFHSDRIRKNIEKQLVQRVCDCNFHHECGIIGSRYIYFSLTQAKRFDLAYKMATQTSYPSVGAWIKNNNTNLVETWHDNMSKNHHMFSDIASFFIKSIVGINIDFTAKDVIVIKPNGFNELKFASGFQNINDGTIRVNWQNLEKYVELKISVPKELKYKLELPKDYKQIEFHNSSEDLFKLQKC